MPGPLIHTLIKIQTKCFFIFLCLITMSMNGLTQNKGLNQKISISLKGISLEKALDSVAQKTNTYFTYNSNILMDQPLVNLEAKEESKRTARTATNGDVLPARNGPVWRESTTTVTDFTEDTY